MKKIRKFLAFFFICSMAFSIASFLRSEDSGPSGFQPVAIKYGDWDRIYIRPYYLTNDIWGKLSITDYDQYIYRWTSSSLFPSGWKWRWPQENLEQVKSYPNISFGRSPWEESSTISWLPRQIDSIDELNVTYDISLKATGKYNLSFDLWITKTSGRTTPPDINVVREVMIWLDNKNIKPIAGWFVSKTVIDGEAYTLYAGKNQPIGLDEKYKRDYIAFYKEIPEYKGNTRISEFLKYLVKKNYIKSEEYFRNISLGNEVWYGIGEAVINDYSISIKEAKRGEKTGTAKKTQAKIISLDAPDATLTSKAKLKYEDNPEGGNIGWWTSADDEIGWSLSIPAAGEYSITASVACDPAFPGSTVKVTLDGKTFTFTIADTGGWFNFVDVPLGKIALEAGDHKVSVKASKVKNQFVCNLRSISFAGN